MKKFFLREMGSLRDDLMDWKEAGHEKTLRGRVF